MSGWSAGPHRPLRARGDPAVQFRRDDRRPQPQRSQNLERCCLRLPQGSGALQHRRYFKRPCCHRRAGLCRQSKRADHGSVTPRWLRLWTAGEGSYSPVVAFDNSVFLVSDESKLVRLDARNGDVIWAVDLPYYKRDRTRKDAYAHFGPVLAGGRLLVASSDGGLRSFDPASGAMLSMVDIPSGAASPPAIVGGVLYILSAKGQLHAYR